MATKKTKRKPAASHSPVKSKHNTYKNSNTGYSTKSVSPHSKGETDSIIDQNPFKQGLALILFAVSILIFCVILVRGEHLWNMFHNFLWGLLGKSSFLLPCLLVYMSLIIAFDKQERKISHKIWFSVSIMLLFSACFYIFSKHTANDKFLNELIELYSLGVSGNGAGFLSGLLGIPITYAFGQSGAEIITIILLFVMTMFLSGKGLIDLVLFVSKPFRRKRKNNHLQTENKPIVYHNCKQNRKDIPIDIPISSNESHSRSIKVDEVQTNSKTNKNEKFEHLKKACSNTLEYLKKPESDITEPKDNPDLNEDSATIAAAAFMAKRKANENVSEHKDSLDKHSSEELNDVLNKIDPDKQYNFPPTELLEPSIENTSSDIENELQVRGKMLVDTLKNFNVQTQIVNINRGPTVTRYELQPAPGVKISKITNLADDIALNLAAPGVRIEAPIPGKAAVGVEVPNQNVNIVKMRELLESKKFTGSKSKLTVILGKDISGNISVADLAKMPHLLIAGSTGSGKSVCINSFIISLLYKSTPDEVRLLMIDPKVVELGIYNGIPHLLMPVVTDPKESAKALNCAVSQMLKRYKTFAEYNVRDLQSYNKMVLQRMKDSDGKNDEDIPKLMPQIVIIIDELADLMMAAPNEVEDSICRLAQMARAAGMHLVIATQRPSVDVITGLIKANIPSRIALAVSSQIDSRTILDATGAEKLLGRGDMLFSPVGSQKPIRVQGCYVTDEEIENVIAYLKQGANVNYDQEIIDEIKKAALASSESDNTRSTESTDELMNDAIECILENGQASTSFLQRRLRIGYARAGRLIDEMEQMGIVGPPEGSKPRQILITKQEFFERKALYDNN